MVMFTRCSTFLLLLSAKCLVVRHIKLEVSKDEDAANFKTLMNEGMYFTELSNSTVSLD